MKKLYRISMDVHVDDSDMFIVLDDTDNINAISDEMDSNFDPNDFTSSTTWMITLHEYPLDKINVLPPWLKKSKLFDKELCELDDSIDDFFIEYKEYQKELKKIQLEKEYQEKHQEKLF